MRTLVMVAALMAAGCGKKADDKAITGVVWDPWQKKLAGVTVTTPDGRTATTGADGKFRLPFDQRPERIAYAKPGYALADGTISAGTGSLQVAPKTLVPVPPGEGVFVFGKSALEPLPQVTLTKLPVTITPEGTPGKQLYTITGTPMPLARGYHEFVARGSTQLQRISIHERAPAQFELGSSPDRMSARPLKLPDGGDMIHIREDPGAFTWLIVPRDTAEPTQAFAIRVQ